MAISLELIEINHSNYIYVDYLELQLPQYIWNIIESGIKHHNNNLELHQLSEIHLDQKY